MVIRCDHQGVENDEADSKEKRVEMFLLRFCKRIMAFFLRISRGTSEMFTHRQLKKCVFNFEMVRGDTNQGFGKKI